MLWVKSMTERMVHDVIFEHARCGSFPCDSVSLVSTVIDPSTGD